jgi:hypothetical protein
MGQWLRTTRMECNVCVCVCVCVCMYVTYLEIVREWVAMKWNEWRPNHTMVITL